jgi:hypothetical protein
MEGGVGLRMAVVEEVKRHTMEWSWTREKLMNVLFVSLRRALGVIERERRERS